MITVGYIVSFIIFLVVFLFSIYLFLYHKKLKWIAAFGTVLFGIMFLILIVWDRQIVQRKSEVASELITEQNANEEDTVSEWNKKICQYEQSLLDGYQWDKGNIALERGTNEIIMAEAFQNVLFSYLKADNINDSYEYFIENKGEYIGRYCEIRGECIQISNGTEIVFLEKLFSENPDCNIKAYYCTYEDAPGKYIVLRPEYRKNIDKEDIYYLYGMYAGEITVHEKQYDFYVMNQ